MCQTEIKTSLNEFLIFFFIHQFEDHLCYLILHFNAYNTFMTLPVKSGLTLKIKKMKKNKERKINKINKEKKNK